jgi:hypothetical protein
MSQRTKSHVALSSGKTVSPLATEVCTDLQLAPPAMADLYRYLGYAREAVPGPHVTQRVAQIVEEALSHVRPQGTFSLYKLTSRTPRSLRFGGRAAIFGNIGEFLAPAERIAIFVVTIGDAVSRFAEQARRNGDALAEWIVDAFGSWAAEAAADALLERVQHYAAEGEALTLRYSPGYCGMDMDQQRTLFEMVEADAVGVKLLPSLLMYPLKTISGIVGFAQKEAAGSSSTPCDRCAQLNCHMRR